MVCCCPEESVVGYLVALATIFLFGARIYFLGSQMATLPEFSVLQMQLQCGGSLIPVPDLTFVPGKFAHERFRRDFNLQPVLRQV
jgi:hypothetical protein